MAEAFVSEIRIFAGNFAPKGWALCNGQLLPISQNTALFSLLGTFYGGDGKSNFALPNLQGSGPMHVGQGPGLSMRDLGESSGEATVTLLSTEMPQHTHQVVGDSNPASVSAPGGGVTLAVADTPTYANAADLAPMAPDAIGVVGANQPHNNMQPYLGLTFIIAMQGVFPPRS